MNTLTTTVARILFGIPFLVMGVMHLLSGAQMAGMVPAFVPGGVVWVYITGLALIAGGVSIISRIKIHIACLLLALLLLIFIVTIHIPGLSNPQMAQLSVIMLLKDLGLMAGSLILAGNYQSR